MPKEGKRNSNDWCKIDIRKTTRTKLCILKAKQGTKTVDEIIQKLLG